MDTTVALLVIASPARRAKRKGMMTVVTEVHQGVASRDEVTISRAKKCKFWFRLRFTSKTVFADVVLMMPHAAPGTHFTVTLSAFNSSKGLASTALAFWT